jgi:hypothetical protein
VNKWAVSFAIGAVLSVVLLIAYPPPDHHTNPMQQSVDFETDDMDLARWFSRKCIGYAGGSVTITQKPKGVLLLSCSRRMEK